MTERIPAVLDRIEAQQQQQLSSVIPDDIPLEEIADRVVRGRLKLSPPQMRLLIELLPYHRPKLTAVAVGVMNGDSFVAQLDRAIERQERAKQPPKMIDVTPVQPHPASELKGPFARLRRRI
jgi:hypothetical protein